MNLVLLRFAISLRETCPLRRWLTMTARAHKYGQHCRNKLKRCITIKIQ